MKLLPEDQWTAELTGDGRVVVCVAEWPVGYRYFAPITLGTTDRHAVSNDAIGVVVDPLEMPSVG